MMTTEQKISVMQAFVDGKPLEIADKGRDNWETLHLTEYYMSWSWEKTDYRIKPEPKLIPWTCETAPDNLMIRGKLWGKGTYVHANVHIDGVAYLNSSGSYASQSWDFLLRDFEQRDGSPCGEVVE